MKYNYSNRAFLFLCFALSLLVLGCSESNELDLENPSVNETKFYRIPVEELNGWDDGIYSEELYILASYDKEKYCTRYHISDFSDSIANGVSFLLNDEGQVVEVGNRNICVNIKHSDDGYLFSWFDSNGQLNGYFVKSDTSQKSKAVTRTVQSGAFGVDDLGGMLDIFGNMSDAGTLAADLFDADTYKFLNDLMGIGADGIIGLLPFPINFAISSLKAIIDGNANSLYERQRRAMYGDCNIKIEEISNDGNGNINVYVTIENANTVPSHLYHLYYTEPESVTRNTVYWGVVGRNGSVPYLSWYTQPYHYEELLDCNISSSQYKMLTFEMPHKGETYYFRAYLKSLRLRDAKNKVSENHIKYSEKYEYSALDAYITNFKQNSQESSGEDLVFKCTVSGYINSLDNLIEWGIYYLDDNNNYTYFPSKFTLGYMPPEGVSSQPNSDDVEIEIPLKSNSFVDGYKDVKLGVYTKGGFSLTYNGWSEPQLFTLKQDNACNDANHVHAVDLGLSVKWACCNIGATKPEEYGGYYAWGETEEKSNYTGDTYKWGYTDGTITGWNVTKYCVHESCGNVDNKTVLEPADDVAHVKWGGSWRMPTLDEIRELVNRCSWEWTSLNGVDGYRVTGPNGNSIFLPAAGYRYCTEFDNRGTTGRYWSSSLGGNYSYYYYSKSAYGLHFYDDYYDWNNWDGGYDRRGGRSVRPVSE